MHEGNIVYYIVICYIAVAVFFDLGLCRISGVKASYSLYA